MKTTIPWAYDGHRQAFYQALTQTRAVYPSGKLNPEYGAALYLLTGLEGAWPRLSQYVTMDGIDHRKMVKRVTLCSGEKLVVRLSGNLFNGGTYVKMTPLDLVNGLDGDTRKMVLAAFELRRESIRLTLEDVADN